MRDACKSKSVSIYPGRKDGQGFTTAVRFSALINGYKPFEKYPILVQARAGDNFSRRNTYRISRIAPKPHSVKNYEPNAGMEQKRVFFRGLDTLE